MWRDHYHNDSSHNDCEEVPAVNVVKHHVDLLEVSILTHGLLVVAKLCMSYFSLELGKAIFLKYQTRQYFVCCHEMCHVYSRHVDCKAYATIQNAKDISYVYNV
jgi:hypothetical protein